MILFLYNLALLIAVAAGAPWWLWQTSAKRKYREGLRERLGRVRALKGAHGRRMIWVHAVSVGEVLAVSRLVSALDAALPKYFVAISTTTRTGQALARERFGRDRVFYCPLDLPWAVRAYLRAHKPAMLVLAETEFWPNLLNGCFRRGIPVVVVNARISDRSWPRYRRLRGLWRPWLGQLAAALAQTETDAERLRALGCAPERVSVSGNLKFDVRVSPDTEATRLLRALTVTGAGAGDLRWVVAGSTVEGEEALVLAAWAEVLAGDSRLALVLAPRHPERFGAVAELLEHSGVRWRRRTDMAAGAGTRELAAGEVVLLDSIGELASVYSLASVAFVGGSLVAAGGHNPLEPAQFGVPVVMGEFYSNFRAIVEALRGEDALALVTAEDLAGVMASLLRDRDAAVRMGERGRLVFERQAGATERTVAVIQQILMERGRA